MMLWTLCFLLYLLVGESTDLVSNEELISLREETRSAFLHAYDSYLKYGYPHDEVMPLSCKPRRHDERWRGTLDDVLGGYMLTLVDSLDSLIIMKEYQRFSEALLLLSNLTFDRNIDVSTFEANIRVLGGLLSAHQLAVSLFDDSVYDGAFLLSRAIDLGNRLLPAFNTRTGIPIHKVNLRYGIDSNEKTETCPAAGGSFLVEMGLLSRLSGDPRYEIAARKATKALWERRSKIDLVGAMIDTKTGSWIHSHSGIGAGIDSFFETLLKGYILLGDIELLNWFEAAYDAAQHHMLREEFHVEVNMKLGRNGPVYSEYVSSLQAFWPGLQVLAGRVPEAEKYFASFVKLWKKHKNLPDMFDLSSNLVVSHSRGYPLRPELVESAYHLYSATRKQKYLKFARDSLHSIQNNTKTACGYAAIADVRTNRLDDRMDSYFLAETLMYIYLIFDEALPTNMRSSVFCHGGVVHEGGKGAAVPADGNIECLHIDCDTRSTQHLQQDGSNLMKDTIMSVIPQIDGEVVAAGVETSSQMLQFASRSGATRVLVDSDQGVNSSQNCTSCRFRNDVNSTGIPPQQSSPGIDTRRQSMRCVHKVSSLFSTEGHLMLIDPFLRPLLPSSPSRNKKRVAASATDDSDRHTCWSSMN